MLKTTKQKGKENIRKSRKRGAREQGITLVALVITIIILIILATVAINLAFGNNGLITRTQQAKLQQEIETARETLTMVLGDAFIEKKINPEYDQNEFLDEFIKKKESNVYLEESAIGLNGHVFGLDRSVPQLGEYQGELTGPRIQEIKVTSETTNSASIEVVTVNAENATYEYWYKNNKDGQDKWVQVKTDENINTCTIEGLTQGEIYNIRVMITTKEGNITGKTNVHLGEIPKGTITFTPAEWVENGTAKVTINTEAEEYELQYIVVKQNESVEGIEDREWTTIASESEITGLHHGDTVYGRLFDGVSGTKDDAIIKIQDGNKPTVNMTVSAVTATTIKVSVDAEDNESGIYSYRFEKSTDNSNFEEVETITDITSTYTYEGLKEVTTYYLRVIVTDKGNNQETSEIVVQETPIANTSPVISNIALNNKTTNSITINTTATDSEDDKITYKLYTSTSDSSGFTEKAILEEKNPGTQVSLTASGLTQYTTYYYYVEASDQETSAKSEIKSVKTYCPGTGFNCNGPFSNVKKCGVCDGVGLKSHTHDWTYKNYRPGFSYQCAFRFNGCLSNGGGNPAYCQVFTCTICGQVEDKNLSNVHDRISVHEECIPLYIDKKLPKTGWQTCTRCDGNGSYTQSITCSHGKSSSHQYCSHNRTSQHD